MEVTCHCGAVQLVLAMIPEQVAECNCSICRRYAAYWGYFTPDEVTIEGDTDYYCWGDEEVEFHRCRCCGCLTHYITTSKCPERILAVNMRLAPLKLLSGIAVRAIDGENRT